MERSRTQDPENEKGEGALEEVGAVNGHGIA
jgi:hypothetical protein